MKFLLSWIREFVPAALPLDELARRLTSAGLPVETMEPLPGGDALLDLEVFPNRPDCMNVYGVAREIAAAAGETLRPYPGSLREDPSAPSAADRAHVTIEEPALCRRYDARVVLGVRVAPSPAWMADRLAAIGLRPLNNVVDATNYVLWEYGHPLHAFDLATLAGAEIRVRRAARGERLVTLDGVERALDEDTLVIADARRAVALAGIMGGHGTMVTSSTRDLLIESAHFDPVSVRRTAKRLGLSTDASYRFERGADLEATSVALDRVASILRESAGGAVARGRIGQRGAPAPVRRLTLRPRRASVLIGIPLDQRAVTGALSPLGFKVEQEADDLQIEVPSHRSDVEREVDLIEEVARRIGYDAVPGRLPAIAGAGGIDRPGHARLERAVRALRAAGYSEAVTFSFTSAPADAGLGAGRPGGEEAEPVLLSNPIAADQECLRTTLLAGLLDSLARNVNRGVRDVRLFEAARTFRRASRPESFTAAAGRDAGGAPVEERLTLALAVTGAARPRHWLDAPREAGLWDLKGAVESALAEAGCAVSAEPAPGTEAFEDGATAWILVGGRRAGRLGALTRAWCQRLGLKQEALAAEIDLAIAFAGPERLPSYTPIPRHPAVARDLSLVVPAGRSYAELERAVRDAAAGLAVRVEAVDRYAGPELPRGAAGLTLRVTFRHPERTLASEEVNQAQETIVEALARGFGVSLRR
ncbi:MAG TPA: phenylalanine--tRNA ligase subunit beta [Candidatus Polarisedimenticolia bacterium]|nr:phenylalanine--tRNA ligase subunit beta [Candidatus Polarisedimenticolia bacterium]